MDILVFPDAETVAKQAATFIAESARACIARRGLFTFAASGGTTPWRMLQVLAQAAIQWGNMHLFQVDERVAPDGDAARNWTHLNDALLAKVPIPDAHAHPMLVTLPDPGLAARRYADTLQDVTGKPAVLDLVHLGLGADGHTASLVPDDPTLDVTDVDVALTGVYRDLPRITLTYPLINRARSILWVVTGPDKQDALRRLLHGDPSIPAGRVSAARATVIADAAAIGSTDKP